MLLGIDIYLQYLGILLLGFALVVVSYVWQIKRQCTKRRNNLSSFTVAFFHPYCNDGGGGERVLWCSVKALQELRKDAECIIYTGEEPNVTPETILTKVKNHFNITLPREVKFIFLKKRWSVEAETYPHFTLLGQSLGSMILGWEALNRLVPHVFIDTMGYAFTYPLFKWIGGCRVGCYVHYPTISTDMLRVVAERKINFNHNAAVARSRWKTQAKLWYYNLFSKMYSFVGARSEVVMVNSTWTLNHINSLWKIPKRTRTVYPPCNTTSFQQFASRKKEPFIISIGQFRPEKDHFLQIESMNEFLKLYPEWRGKVKLVMIGSCRNEKDKELIQKLRNTCSKYSLEDSIEFRINASFAELQDWLSKAMIGVHTMRDEHFGIGVVELMAAGVIPVAHNSAGPKEDIVVPFEGNTTGFLATTPSEYAESFQRILSLSPEERLRIQENAGSSVSRFSDSMFNQKFKENIAPLVT